VAITIVIVPKIWIPGVGILRIGMGVVVPIESGRVLVGIVGSIAIPVAPKTRLLGVRILII
jgi:hypothetical protein